MKGISPWESALGSHILSLVPSKCSLPTVHHDMSSFAAPQGTWSLHYHGLKPVLWIEYYEPK